VHKKHFAFTQQRVPRIKENYHWVLRIKENYHWVAGIKENYHRVPRIREIGSLQVHTRYLTFSLKKTVFNIEPWNLLQNIEWKYSEM